MRRTSLCAALIGLCCAGGSHAQVRPDFSGGWTEERPSGSPNITITQTGERIVISRPPAGPVSRFPANGSELVTPLVVSECMDRELRTRSAWDGNRLVVTEIITTTPKCSHRSEYEPISLRRIERRTITLVLDGDTLSIETVSQGANGRPVVDRRRYRRN